MGATSYIVIGGQASIVAVANVIPPDPEPTFGPTFWATVGLVITTLITSVAGLVFQAYRESRDRRWKAEDDAKKEVIRLTAAETKEVLAQKIDENTEISRQAFVAANNFNEKFATIAAAAPAALVLAQVRTADATESLAAAAETVARAADTKS